MVRIFGRGLPTHQIRSKSGKKTVDVRTDGRTHPSSVSLLGHRLAMTPKIGLLIEHNRIPEPYCVLRYTQMTCIEAVAAYIRYYGHPME